MDDFLATSIRYYAEFNLERQAPRKPDDSAEEAFAAVVKGIKAFMDEATRVDEEFRQLWRETVDSFQRQREPELKEHAAEVQGAVMNLAKELLPKVQAQEPLPLELLQQLNAAVQRFESRYSGALGKSDLLPEQLLTAAPGSKLYPGLLKKVEAICHRSIADFEQREVDTFRAWLQQGAHVADFDTKVKALSEDRESKIKRLVEMHQDCLVQSDHLPLIDEVQLGDGHIKVMIWNTLEFPSLNSSPVTDGILPYCSEVTATLERKTAEERALLLGALCSEAAIRGHIDLIWTKVRDFLEDCDGVVLLQEANKDVVAKVKEECDQRRWTALFSQANENSSKCNAITGIVSKQPFDQEAQVEVAENKKLRFFMAARQQDTWFVSCHVPLVVGKTVAPKANEDLATKVLEQIASDLPGARTLVAGGDWNADVYEVASRKPTGRPLRLYAPSGRTAFGNHHTIDGVFCLS